MSLVLRWSGS